ncbi:MAG: hypothetical protein KatS3mg052_0779 [Candidatus Roseilinea sp.]|nr:MAG: hypothetical protein KatS3mg052_0779 [Candidatus Roseilinea sp.]
MLILSSAPNTRLHLTPLRCASAAQVKRSPLGNPVQKFVASFIRQLNLAVEFVFGNSSSFFQCALKSCSRCGQTATGEEVIDVV